MHKNLLLLSLSLLTYSANAQSKVIIAQEQLKQITVKKHSATLKKILTDQGGKSQLKTTAAHERLSSSSFYIAFSGPQLVDSNNYFYSNARGSSFDFSQMYYTDGVLFDSTSIYSDNGSGVDLTNGQTAKYDVANRRTAMTVLNSNPSGTPLKNSSQTLYVYDASGNNTMLYMLNWISATSKWDTINKIESTFNSSNQKITETYYTKNSGTWNLDNKNTMTYDGSGNMVSTAYASWSGTAWEDQSRETLTYYPSKKVQTNLAEDFDGTSWVASTLDTFGYNSTDFYTYNEERDWNIDSNRWDNSSLEIRHLNSANLPDTTYSYDPDSATGVYQLSFINAWSYNSNNNPVTSEGSFYFMGTPIPVTNQHFYYENYWDLGVKNIADKNTFSVYPNPANDVLNITADKAFKANVTANIMNTSGQLVLKSEATAGAKGISLSIGALQPGTYFLVLADAQGNRLYTQSVVRQ